MRYGIGNFEATLNMQGKPFFTHALFARALLALRYAAGAATAEQPFTTIHCLSGPGMTCHSASWALAAQRRVMAFVWARRTRALVPGFQRDAPLLRGGRQPDRISGEMAFVDVRGSG